MSAPPGNSTEKTDPTGQHEAAHDLSAEVEQLVHERTQEIRKENEALQRVNAALQERVEECPGLRRHECQEALDKVQTYSEELTVANEELHQIMLCCIISVVVALPSFPTRQAARAISLL